MAEAAASGWRLARGLALPQLLDTARRDLKLTTNR